MNQILGDSIYIYILVAMFIINRPMLKCTVYVANISVVLLLLIHLDSFYTY